MGIPYHIINRYINVYFNQAQWLSWLERRPVTAEVESSSLFWVVDMEHLIEKLLVGWEVLQFHKKGS